MASRNVSLEVTPGKPCKNTSAFLGSIMVGKPSLRPGFKPAMLRKRLAYQPGCKVVISLSRCSSVPSWSSTKNPGSTNV